MLRPYGVKAIKKKEEEEKKKWVSPFHGNIVMGQKGRNNFHFYQYFNVGELENNENSN